MERRTRRDGFTLIEMSVVLVIIGLIVGGLLVGRDLVRAAELRAQISQIEKYHTAANTFQEKYGYLPGDIPDPVASRSGLAARGVNAGEGDGSGVIEGNIGNTPGVGMNSGIYEQTGEIPMFWVDLSTTLLIDGGFNSAGAGTQPYPSGFSGATLAKWFPTAKLGQGNYVYVWSWNNLNYYGLSALTTVDGSGLTHSTPGLTVQQANGIDTKVDDGRAQTGRVIAQYLNKDVKSNKPAWAAGGGVAGASSSNNPTTAATPGSSTTCYDNGNTVGVQLYSIKQNAGTGMNCAISFQFQ